MSLNEGIAFGDEASVLETHTAKHHRLGQLLMLPDGRKFRYAYASELLQGVGRASVNYNHAPGSDSNANGYEGAMSSATDAGVVELTFPDTTARVADFYESGYVIFYQTADTRYWTQRIKSSGVSAGTTVTIQLESPTPFAVSASDQITAHRSPFSNVTSVHPGEAQFETFVGIVQAYVAAARWCWIQTAGPCLAVAHGGTWPGNDANSRSVFFYKDGTIDPSSIATASDAGAQRAGYLLATTRSGYGDNFIMLQLE